jgi:hypothetical protein
VSDAVVELNCEDGDEEDYSGRCSECGEENGEDDERLCGHCQEIFDAVAAEREACAKMAEEFAESDDGADKTTCYNTARLIRARGQSGQA